MFDFVKILTISLDPFGTLSHQCSNVLTLYHDEGPLHAVSVDDCEELLHCVNTLP